MQWAVDRQPWRWKRTLNKEGWGLYLSKREKEEEGGGGEETERGRAGGRGGARGRVCGTARTLGESVGKLA